MFSVITRERNHEIKKKMLTAGRHHKDRSRQTSQMKKSKARRGQVTCPRYRYQGQKQDTKDSSEQADKGRDSLKIDWESHSHSTSKTKRRTFFLKAKKIRFHSLRTLLISSTEPVFRRSTYAALKKCMGVLVGATFQICFPPTFIQKLLKS